MSRCYWKLGRIDEAMDWFEEAVRRYTARRDYKTDFDWRESYGGTETLVMTSGVILDSSSSRIGFIGQVDTNCLAPTVGGGRNGKQ